VFALAKLGDIAPDQVTLAAWPPHSDPPAANSQSRAVRRFDALGALDPDTAARLWRVAVGALAGRPALRSEHVGLGTNKAQVGRSPRLTWAFITGADDGNRTRVLSLGS
jgi:hypothetical protein